MEEEWSGKHIKNSVLKKKMKKNKSQTSTNLILNNFVNLLSLKTSHCDTFPLPCYHCGLHYFNHWTTPPMSRRECPEGHSSPPSEQGDRGPLAQCWWQGRQEPCHHRALHFPCQHYIILVEGHVQMWDQTLLSWESFFLAHQLPALPAQVAWENLVGYSYPIKLVIPK